jgi:exonuclease SbcD
MRALHTSDWHVGKLIRGRSRAVEHRAVLDEIVDIAEREEVDLILVGGDLYETSAPGPESEEIVYQALLRLAATDAPVAVIAGNHDNPGRLRAVAPLLDLGRIHLVAEPTRADEGGVWRLEVGDESVSVAMLPFVSQRGIVRADELLDAGADQRSPLYADRLRAIVDVLTSGFSTETVNIVLAHLMVIGGVMGGGERDAHTVFEYSVPPTVFPVTAQYVALGHLHRAQALAGACPIRYCGSPLQLDFGETADTKSVTLVDAAPGAPSSTREVELQSGRRLRTIEGPLEQLRELADTTGDDWLRVKVHEQVSAGLGDQVREWFPDAVDVQIVRPEQDDEAQQVRASRTGQSPTELFATYLREQDVDDERVEQLFGQLLEEVG